MEKGSSSPKDDVILVRDEEGALSLELEPLRDGVARAFPRFSPRSLRLSESSAKNLSKELSSRPFSKILVQDSRKKVVRRALGPLGWGIAGAVPRTPKPECFPATTYDLPLDEGLVDTNGAKPELANTNEMRGIGVGLDGRKAWAFYSDEGDTARIISEGERRQGLLVATRTEDLYVVADCLLRHLASAKKSWAVFSMDMGRFVRSFDPITLMRLSVDSPKPFDHRGVPLSKDNRKAALRLFSEYYDESMLQSVLRLRRLKNDGNFMIFLVDGGFVITKLEGEVGLLYDIYVTPSKQGQGLGIELMKCAMTSLAGRAASVYLHTSYPRAKRLYEKFGFKMVYSQLGIRLDEIALSPPSAE